MRKELLCSKGVVVLWVNCPNSVPCGGHSGGGYRAIGTRPIAVRKGTIRVISGVGNIGGRRGHPNQAGDNGFSFRAMVGRRAAVIVVPKLRLRGGRG